MAIEIIGSTNQDKRIPKLLLPGLPRSGQSHDGRSLVDLYGRSLFGIARGFEKVRQKGLIPEGDKRVKVITVPGTVTPSFSDGKGYHEAQYTPAIQAIGIHLPLSLPNNEQVFLRVESYLPFQIPGQYKDRFNWNVIPQRIMVEYDPRKAVPSRVDLAVVPVAEITKEQWDSMGTFLGSFIHMRPGRSWSIQYGQTDIPDLLSCRTEYGATRRLIAVNFAEKAVNVGYGSFDDLSVGQYRILDNGRLVRIGENLEVSPKSVDDLVIDLLSSIPRQGIVVQGEGWFNKSIREARRFLKRLHLA